MFKSEPTAQESTADELAPRTRRALTECMTVLPKGGNIYTVVGENGHTYEVDARDVRCTCPDHQHRTTHCKHLRRVAYATGAKPIPEGVSPDPFLGQHVPEREQVARRLGYDGFEDAPATVRRQIQASLPAGVSVTDDAWGEVLATLAEAVEA